MLLCLRRRRDGIRNAKNSYTQGLFFLFCRSWRAFAPLQFALWQCIAVLHGLSFAVLTPVTQLFFERATALATGHADMLR